MLLLYLIRMVNVLVRGFAKATAVNTADVIWFVLVVAGYSVGVASQPNHEVDGLR